MSAILDTSFLLALSFSRDHNHKRARASISSMPTIQIIPMPVLFETFYMITARMNYQQAVQFLRTVLHSRFAVTNLTAEDLERMLQIQTQYQDAEFDFADTSIMALAERLDIQQVYSFDRRDFHIFRPSHCKALDILPA